MALLNFVGTGSKNLGGDQSSGIAIDNAWDADFQFIDGMMFDNGDLTLQKGWASLVSKNLEQSAKRGSCLAQSCLSHMYREGFGVERDPVKAFQWCSAAAKHEGGTEATFELAMMYFLGLGVKKNRSTAILLLDVAAKQDNPLALFKLAEHFIESGGKEADLKKGFDACYRSAELGLAEAQFNVGVMFEDGIGTKKDFKKAAIWYEAAVAAGDKRAMNNLGNLYLDGKGVEKNKLKATDFYAMAAENNSRFGQFNLGLIHDERGTKSSKSHALSLFLKSCSQGTSEIKYNVNHFIAKIPVKSIIRASQNARRLFVKDQT